MQELDKFNLKINVIQHIEIYMEHQTEKFMSLRINNMLGFIDSFQFLGSSLNSLVKNLSKNDLKYLSKKFDGNILVPVKQNGFYRYEYMNDFLKFKEKLPSKKSAIVG